MSQEVQELKSESEIIQEKRMVWADMGAAVYVTEQTLKLKADKSISKLIIPTTLSEVSQAHDMINEVNREGLLIKGEREQITRKFDALKERLMLPEKSFAEPIKKAVDACIKIKQDHEAAQRKVQAKNDEIARVRTTLTLKRNELDASFKTKILNAVNLAYTTALETGAEPSKIGAFMNVENEKVNVDSFKIINPSISVMHITSDEAKVLIDELFVFDLQSYVNKFREDLDIRFSDYSIAFNNRTAALQIANTEALEKQVSIEQEKNINQVAAQLEAASSPVNGELGFTGVKALKRSYEVDMAESLSNSIIVMSAFVANKSLIEPMMKVNKWDSFNIGQMKNYLGKCKCNDNAFQPAGITYKEVNKL